MRTTAGYYRFGFFSLLFAASLFGMLYTESFLYMLIPFAALAFYAGWLQKDTAFYILIASLPFSFEYQVSPSLGTDLPDEPLMLGVSFLFFCAWLYKPALLHKKIWQQPLLWILLAGFGWSILSALFSTDSVLSFKYLLAKTWYYGAFILAPVLVWTDQKKMRSTLIIFLIALLLAMGWVLTRQAMHGFTFATVSEAAAPFFRNHVNYSAMLVCGFPLLLVSYRHVRTRKAKQLLVMLMLLLVTALFLSYARGAWLALIAGIFAGLILRSGKLFAVYLIAVVLLAGSFVWISRNDQYLRFAHDYKTTIFHTNFEEHLLATYRLKDVSAAERFYRWIAAIRMTRDYALTGSGPNTFYSQYRPYAIPAFKTWVSNNADHSTVHNYFLLMLAEQGYPGLVLFLLLAGAMFYTVQKKYLGAPDSFYKSLYLAVAMILTMILTVNFLSDLIETDKLGSLFYLCVAALLIFPEKREIPAA